MPGETELRIAWDEASESDVQVEQLWEVHEDGTLVLLAEWVQEPPHE